MTSHDDQEAMSAIARQLGQANAGKRQGNSFNALPPRGYGGAGYAKAYNRGSNEKQGANHPEQLPKAASPISQPIIPPPTIPKQQPISIPEPPLKAKTYPIDESAKAPEPPLEVPTPNPTPNPQPSPLTQVMPQAVDQNSGLWAVSLGKKYKKKTVLHDITLHVQRGEAVGLLGPNGAGKTTSFYIISGLIGADMGKICLDGVDITRLPMYRRARMGIGYLPQEPSIFRGLNVADNILAVLESSFDNRQQRMQALEELLAEFSITHLRNTPSQTLSGGERRRLEIARALASRPHFIMLDEPLAGIDPISVKDIRELVSHLKQRGIGVLITDHNVRDTLEIVDRAYILHGGKILHEGTPADIVANEEVRRVYLGDQFSLNRSG